MPEHPTMSIKVTVAPEVAAGLETLVRKVLTGAAAERPAKSERTGRPPIINRSEGTVRGTLFQIGNVEGSVNHYDR